MSSRKRRGKGEVAEDAAGALAKDVMVVPIGGKACCKTENDVPILDSVRFVRERVMGDCKESIDVAGDTPSVRYERRRRCYNTDCGSVVEHMMVQHGKRV